MPLIDLVRGFFHFGGVKTESTCIVPQKYQNFSYIISFHCQIPPLKYTTKLQKKPFYEAKEGKNVAWEQIAGMQE